MRGHCGKKKRCTSHELHPLYISGAQFSIPARTSHDILLDLETRSLRGNTVTFCNTHSNFADIIQAEILEPKLSNSIPNPSHHFTHLRAFCIIPNDSEIHRTFRPHSAHHLRPCLQILHSITLALIVSNCLSFSCCTMIRDTASYAPSVVPSKYCFRSSCIPDSFPSSI